MILTNTLNGWKAAMADQISASGSASAVPYFSSQSASAAAASPAIIHVGSTNDLVNALGHAKGGETIILDTGTYSDLVLKDLNFTSTVTIKSAAALGATFANIAVQHSSNIIFDGIAVNHTSSPAASVFDSAVIISNSDHITVTNAELHGSMDGNYLNDGKLILVRDSNNFTLNNSNLHDGHFGLQVLNGSNTIITKNNFHDLRSDGADFSNASNTLVENNSFSNFHPNWGSGKVNQDHPDCLQFWLSNTTSTFTGNIVRGNTFLPGNSTGQIQGIFVQALAHHAPGVAHYSDFLIENNVIYSSDVNGIALGNVTNSTVRNNTLVGAPGGPHDPGIRLTNTNNIIVENNITTKALSHSGATHTTDINNLTVQYDNPSLPNYYAKVFINGFAGSDATRESFATLPTFQAGGHTARSSSSITVPGAVSYDNAPSHLQALIVTTTNDGTHNGLKASFDASFSANALGKVTSPNAVYQWNFGDGTTATGKIVDHIFSKTGAYDVSLSVSSNGEVSTTKQIVLVESPVVADMNFNAVGSNALNIGLPVIQLYHSAHDTARTVIETAAQENTAHISGSVTIHNGVADFTGGYIDLGDHSHFYGMKELTVALNFKASATIASEFLLDNHKVYSVFLHNNDLVFSLTTSTGAQADITATGINVRDGAWHNVALTYDSSTGSAIAYLDGKSVGHVDGLTGQIATSGTQDVTLGGNSFGNHFMGQIDNLHIVQAVVPPGRSIANAITADPIVSASAKTASSAFVTVAALQTADVHNSLAVINGQQGDQAATSDHIIPKIANFQMDHHFDLGSYFHHDLGLSQMMIV